MIKIYNVPLINFDEDAFEKNKKLARETMLPSDLELFKFIKRNKRPSLILKVRMFFNHCKTRYCINKWWKKHKKLINFSAIKSQYFWKGGKK